MCPVCIATAALLAAGATSSGGLAAIAMKKLLPGHAAKTIPVTASPNLKEKSNGR